MGAFHTLFGVIICIAKPRRLDKCFDAVPTDTIGIEWDASELMWQFIDTVLNIRTYGRKVYHVHAKDARVYRDIVDRYGILHPGAIEHCFVGLGDADWSAIVKELYRAGYKGDLNIEGWHDSVYRDHENGPKLEDTGLLISLRHLSQFVDGT
jgi:sugar phosphate isomerase/epimerase